jgi:Sulfotransferase family
MTWVPPRGDEDGPHLARLSAPAPDPVFVMGVHRSGTTWLYEQLDRLLPVTSATAHDVLAYPRLLALQAQGALDADRAALDARFAFLGLSDRQLDAIPLGHATVEEYGWVLLHRRRRPWLDRATAPVLAELGRKLAAIRPGARAVLLKNPWDHAAGPELVALHPGARFVFLSRDPRWILDSQLRSALLSRRARLPYLEMLVAPAAGGRALLRMSRMMSRAFGERAFAAATARVLIGRLTRELARQRRSREGLPARVQVEVRYEDLVRDPATHLGRVADFLGLPPRAGLSGVTARPRPRPLHPAIASRVPQLAAVLRGQGLWDPAWAAAESGA